MMPSSLRFAMHFAAVACNEGIYVEFPLAPSIVHVTNFPENRTFAPSLVMDTTNRPHASCPIETETSS